MGVSAAAITVTNAAAVMLYLHNKVHNELPRPISP